MTPRLAERAARVFEARSGRRGFLARTAFVGAALAAAPRTYILRPGTAYAAVCGCSGSTCPCGSGCCDGYTEFCCTTSGLNRCPSGTLRGGWWRVDASSFCGGGSRYYIDCNATCGTCSCGSGGICSGGCSGTPCRCGRGSCAYRKTGCTGFRYGQCNQGVRCLGPIVCRLVSCAPPWQSDPACTSAVRVDNATRNHNRPCLSGNPFGTLNSVTAIAGGLRVRGWAIDPNQAGPIRVHIFIDGTARLGVTASVTRNDVARAYPAAGAAHGYDVTIRNVVPGGHTVCANAINVGPGNSNPRLGCANATVSANPFGAFDVAAIENGVLRVRGWAIDPNTNSPIRVHIYDNARGRASLLADQDRPDVQRVHNRGSRHGFDALLPISAGEHEIQAFAINVGAGNRNTLLGTRRVTVGAPAAAP
jgi:hypothetical protein